MTEFRAVSKTTDICDFCLKQICSSYQTQGLSHCSLAALEKSALDHCVFCSGLFCDLRKEKLVHEDLSWPIYRWNLRQSTSIREGQTMIVVTFRPMVQLESNHKNFKLHILPERSFHLYKEEDLGKIPHIADLGKSTNSEESWNQIRHWFDTCRRTHRRCKRTNNNFTPTRLVDISAIQPWNNYYGNVFIVKTRDHGINGPYVTLSHSWGPKNPDGTHPFLNCEPENYDRLSDPKRGIAWDGPELSKNFKEAILVARQLMVSATETVKYIWIDSLCIIQGPKGDFGIEGNFMHQVYRQSLCNIAVADSSDSKGGLFRPRQTHSEDITRNLVPATLRLDKDNEVFGDYVWRVVSQDLWDSQFLNSKLYTRAWVFQERMLAPRLLHFCANQVFWDCATISACDVLPGGLPGPMDTLAATDRHWRERLQDGYSLKHQPLAGTADLSVKKFWKAAVRNFTSCDLTNGNDKMIAIWGVAKLVRDTMSGEAYGAGMWEHGLEDQLTWRVVDCRQANGDPSVRPVRTWGAPSWSWVSMDGIIDLQDIEDNRDYRVTDHEGEPIAFKVKGRARIRKPTKKNSNNSIWVIDYREEFRVWLDKEKEFGDRILQSSPVQSPGGSRISSPADIKHVNTAMQQKDRTPAKSKEAENYQPELENNGIKILGHVRSGIVYKSSASDIWLLRADTVISHSSGSDTGLVEVFPDEMPQESRFGCHFVVLSYTINNEEGTSRIISTDSDEVSADNPAKLNPIYEEAESYEEGSDMANTQFANHNYLVQSPDRDGSSDYIGRVDNGQGRSIMDEQPPQSYTGVGLILEPTKEDDHFLRIGAFVFRDIDKKRLKTLMAMEDGNDRSSGRKFVLV